MKTRAIALASLNELQEIVETVEETELEQMLPADRGSCSCGRWCCSWGPLPRWRSPRSSRHRRGLRACRAAAGASWSRRSASSRGSSAARSGFPAAGRAGPRS